MLRFAAIMLLVMLCACGGEARKQPAAAIGGKAVILNDSILATGIADTLDLGRIHQGETVVKNLNFTNGSQRPLVILSVETSCGCTDIDYPRKPVAPGGSAVTTLYFHSGGLSGYQFKTVTFRTSLGPGRYRLIITADVE